MIGLVLNWIIGSWVGRVVAGVVVGFVAVQVKKAVQRSKGAAIVVAESKEKAKVANAKNEKVRDNARRPGAAERLLKNDCRDC